MATIKKWLKTKLGLDTIIPKTLVEAVYDQEGNNLNQILNGKYTADTVADEYNCECTYDVGDYTIYNNKLYKCVTDIEPGEEFTSDHWELTTCENEIVQLKEAVKELNCKSEWKLLATLVGNNQIYEADLTQYREILVVFTYELENDDNNKFRKYSIHVPVIDLSETLSSFQVGSYRNAQSLRAFFMINISVSAIKTPNNFAYYDEINIGSKTTVKAYVR